MAAGPRLETVVDSDEAEYEDIGEIFDVVVMETEAAVRCGVVGAYQFNVSPTTFSLLLPHTGACLYSWPFSSIRRYGTKNDKKPIFLFEAGRRCESGEGVFKIVTSQFQVIYDLVREKISRCGKMTKGNSCSE